MRNPMFRSKIANSGKQCQKRVEKHMFWTLIALHLSFWKAPVASHNPVLTVYQDEKDESS